ncbi:MAG: bis(5'-nucleosyl)-tetraphosphatase (symmetrical) YqeK [Clostridia bacterium]|nr:bis(5'-nucleosyl)-tetraphosphatase (symmetrical) YqeK [Clostridia bacterium]
MIIDLDRLQAAVKERLSEKRFLHTVGVKEMAILLGRACLPDDLSELGAAALLHDITKECDAEAQLYMLRELGQEATAEDMKSPAILHSYTAPYVILRDFSELATPQILSAVKKHTAGDAEMSVFDKIIFISDFIERGRSYPACIETRNFLLSSLDEGKREDNVRSLTLACIMAIDFTIENLKSKEKSIHPTTLMARNALASEI